MYINLSICDKNKMAHSYFAKLNLRIKSLDSAKVHLSPEQGGFEIYRTCYQQDCTSHGKLRDVDRQSPLEAEARGSQFKATLGCLKSS